MLSLVASDANPKKTKIVFQFKKISLIGMARTAKMAKKRRKPTHAQVVAVAASLPVGVLLVAGHSLPLAVNVALVHTALSGAVVALCSMKSLCKRTPSLFGKNAKGVLGLPHQLAFLPFQCAIRAKLLYRRRFGEEPLWDHVKDGFYIGGWPNEQQSLPTPDAAVVDCTCELPRRHRNPYLLCATWDTQSPTVEAYERGVAFAAEQRREGERPLLVHCAHGHGRSAAMLCAILISQGKAATVDEAERLIKSSRPRVNLNKNQREGLEQWFAQQYKSL